MIDILKTVFADSSNPQKVSSKRIAAFLLVISLVIVVIGNMFFNYSIDEFIFAGLSEAVIWSLGFVGAEKFSGIVHPKPTRKISNNNETEADMY